MNDSILCTICARAGSKGVKNKNIRTLMEKPLIAHTIEQAIESKLFDHIVVSTDSDKIADISQRYGAEVFFKRSSELASDTAGKLGVIKDAFIKSEKHYKKQFDYLIDLDATSPLRMIEDIQMSLQQFIANNNENLITAMPARRNPYFNLLEVGADKKVRLSKPSNEMVLRRQDAPDCFDMNASIYIWKRNTILKEKTIFLNTTGLFVMPEERSIDIDCELDFDFVEFIMEKRKNA